MKATFFTLATLAASAFAAPAPEPVLGGIIPSGPSSTGTPSAPAVPEAPKGGDLLGGLPGFGSKESRQLPDASKLGGAGDLTKVLSGLTEQFKGNFGNISRCSPFPAPLACLELGRTPC